MKRPKRASFSFKPLMNDTRLEERVVLNGARSALVAAATPGNNANANRPFTLNRIRQAYNQSFRGATQDLRRAIRADLNELYANGQPNQQQVTDFNARVQGTLNATNLRLSSQAALLPGAERQLLPGLQNALVGNRPNSLASRLQGIGNLTEFPRPDIAVYGGINREINSVLSRQRGLVDNALSNGNIRQLSTGLDGQQVPVRRYMAEQVLNQFGNNLAGLSQGFGNVASSTLFANGATTATPENLATFQNSATQALGTTLFQLGSGLSLFPNASQDLFPQLQTAFFNDGTLTPPGTGTPGTPQFTNFLNALSGLPTSNDVFSTATTDLFNNGFQNVGGTLGTFLGLPSDALTNRTLPTNPTSLFGPSAANFGGGFNNGFGSGALGFFGQAPTEFNTNFGTGFNNAIGRVNPNFGFNVPTSIFNVPTSTFNPPLNGTNPIGGNPIGGSPTGGIGNPIGGNPTGGIGNPLIPITGLPPLGTGTGVGVGTGTGTFPTIGGTGSLPIDLFPTGPGDDENNGGPGF